MRLAARGCNCTRILPVNAPVSGNCDHSSAHVPLQSVGVFLRAPGIFSWQKKTDRTSLLRIIASGESVPQDMNAMSLAAARVSGDPQHAATTFESGCLHPPL